MKSTRLPALAALLVFAGLPAATATAQNESTARVGALVAEADRLPIQKAWSLLHRLRDLDSVSEDAMLAALQAAGKDAGPVGKLLVARGLLDLGDDGLYGQKAVAFAAPILTDGATGLDLRLAAASLLGDENLQGRAGGKAGEALDAIVRDDTSDPSLRLEAAKSLFRVGNSKSRRTAKETIQSFLASRDRDLKVAGALALYEIGDGFQSGARAILEELESEPTNLGRLARSYLEGERKARQVERMELMLARQKMAEIRRGGESGTRNRDKDFEVLRELRRLIDAAWIDGKKVETETLVESAARGMLQGLDKFSSYLSSDQYSRFAFDLNRHYGGIGAFVRVENGIFQITRPIYSGPAYKAGLLSGDLVLEVDGWETAEQDQDEIIRRLKGVPGTEVELKVMRAGWPEPQDIKLQRAEISVPSVNAEMLPGDIGYAELITFASDTSEELRRQLEKMSAQGAKAVILDLRSNTGGYLRQAQGVAELFLPRDKLVVYTKSRIGPEEKFFSRGDAIFPDLPLVVLVNGTTASASEIVSGALQDHGRATIVGVQSYGKGSVQNLFPLRSKPGEPFEDENRNRRWDSWEAYTDLNKNGKYDPGPRARVTIARYYLPNGRCLHKIVDKDGKIVNPDYGVIPSIEVEAEKLRAEDLWKNAITNKMWRERSFHKYVDAKWDAHKDLFKKLAFSDSKSSKDYPGFDEFYAELDTKLPKDDVRKWVRVVVRDKVADLRGRAWPGQFFTGDFVEDRQLQAAIHVALGKIGQSITNVPEYGSILDLPKEWVQEVWTAGKKLLTTKKGD